MDQTCLRARPGLAACSIAWVHTQAYALQQAMHMPFYITILLISKQMLHAQPRCAGSMQYMSG
jgi:hypothetical protein